jgi:hypothetical protein
MLRTISIVALCALCNAAAPQSVYKCTADGKVTYADTPCTSGAGTELAVSPAPPPDREVLKRQKAFLARLEAERAAGEARDQRRHERNSAAAAQLKQKCDKLRLRQKWADEDLARATGRARDALRLKARRQAEAMAVECPA